MAKKDDASKPTPPVAVPEEKVSVLDIASEALHEVNMTLGAMIPSDPGYDDIVQKRDELNLRFKRLAREAFRDNTVIFVKAGSDLDKVNAKMKSDIQGLKNFQTVIDSITNVIKALDSFIETAFPVK